MGGAPSTSQGGSQSRESAEFLIGALVGEKSYPVTSSIWQSLLEVPLTVQWSQDRVHSACLAFGKNNHQTRHLAKILLHLAWSLRECQANLNTSSTLKAVNAAYISSTFLKHFIENSKIHKFEDLYLEIDESEMRPEDLSEDTSVSHFVMSEILFFIGKSEVSPQSYMVHFEILNFMLVALSTQLRSGPLPEPGDAHPFIDAAMNQGSAVISSVVHKLLTNYITRPHISFSGPGFSTSIREMQRGVLQRISSAAANFVLLPYYTFNYLLNASADGSKSLLAQNSLLVLLVLVHYRQCTVVGESSENLPSNDVSHYSINPYCKAVENARDVELDRVDIEGNAPAGPLVRLPFASLFDALGTCLSEESSVLLLYSLIYGNSNFLEYVFVRTDLDTLLMPILETLYNASRRTSNQIYMLLIILLVLSQDSSFNASIHKLLLPSVPWYRERLLHNTSLGSLMVIILIRTVKYNMSKVRDVYLHTNCLATLANMAPHVHRLSGFASQSLISLVDKLGRKYTKLVEIKQGKVLESEGEQMEGAPNHDDVSAELQIYTDFLRIVLEILNAILIYALPRNPEVVYAVMHRQEVFQPFRNHSRFNELLENIYTVLDFFNSRMDTRLIEGEWSVDKVLQVIITNCRFWHGEGMKMFNQLKFTYEQEGHHEEFFIPYIWQLVLSTSGLTFNPNAIKLFVTDGEANQ
ncbi:dyggve-melchior-clausen syndrome protein [Wolffia australiana]